ncbi:MAG: hydroxymethylglutaryl-CoA synthase [Nitrososphaerota archaeon]|nr:hydroxymethylglutaryl-CoA synthase [Candidatus Calditenuaceae archaeon]MDW8073176.1 hydroxymethylglutaryl-CoA synthase [Nitrososphaerota archaeon]
MPGISGVSIHGYGAYIPIFRIKASEIARVWGLSDSELPVLEKAVNSLDEDTVTIAAEAAGYALARAGIDPGRIGAVYVGSESHPYAVKPTGTIVADVLGVNSRLLSADLEFACKAGTEAMQLVTGLVASRMIDYGLAIGADTAQGRPRDALEYTAAAGGVAVVIGRSGDGAIADFEFASSYVSDTPDFWRRSHERYPMHGSRFTGAPAYFHHIISAVKMVQDEGYSLGDFDYFVFHQPNTKFPYAVAKMLGVPAKKVESGVVCNVIGNTYAASSMMGLAKVLDQAKPGERILMASYGSGAGSDVFVFRVKEGVLEKRGLAPLVSELIERRKYIDYSLYLKARGKIRE